MEKGNWFLQTPIAHRGLHQDREVPENSLRSFELAIENGFPIEFDLQLLKCGTVIVFHDSNTKRLTGVDKVIKESTYEDIKDLKLYETDQKIPTFQDVLDLVQGRVPLIIEIKAVTRTHGIFERKVLDLLFDYKGKYTIQSFNPYVIRWLKNNAPHVVRGLLSYHYKDADVSGLSIWMKFLLRHMLFIPALSPDYIGYEHASLKSLGVSVVRALKLCPIIAWTVDNLEDYQACCHLCDNIIFENIEVKKGPIGTT